MTEFITGVTDVVSGIFEAILNALGTAGNLIFAVGDAGAITGLTPFGWLMVIIIGLPLATWVFGKVFGLIRGIRAR